MKYLITLAIVLALALSLNTGCKKHDHKDHSHKDHNHKDHSHKDHDHDDKTTKLSDEYVCPTPEHFQERSKKKGTKCTKCKREMIQVGTYYCWMHGKKIVTGKKGGKCELCKGMKLVRAGSGKRFSHEKAKDVKDGSKKEEKKDKK